MSNENNQEGCLLCGSNNRFLNYFDIKEYAKSFIGLPLVYGVRIITIFCILLSLLEIFDTNTDFLGFLVAFIEGMSYTLILISSFNNSVKLANFGYFIVSIYFWLTVVLIVLVMLLILMFFQNIGLFLIFTLIAFCYICFKLYFNWVLYSFVFELNESSKNNILVSSQRIEENVNNNETRSAHVETNRQTMDF